VVGEGVEIREQHAQCKSLTATKMQAIFKSKPLARRRSDAVAGSEHRKENREPAAASP